MQIGTIVCRNADDDEEDSHHPLTTSAVHWTVRIGKETMDLSENSLGRHVEAMTDSEESEIMKKPKAKKRGRPPKTKHRANNGRSVTRSKGSDAVLYTGIEAIVVTKKASAGPSRVVDENCTKVNLRTGILYLYKNPRRAEFIATK